MKFNRNLLPLVFLFFIFYFPFFVSAAAPLSASAGNNTGVCPGDSVQIGGNPAATGGTPLYVFSWQPAASLSNPAIANPYAQPSASTNYTLTVTDAMGNSSMSVVNVSVYSLPTVSAGPDQTIIEGTNTVLQGSGALHYYWTPTLYLYMQNSATPVAEPQDSTTFCVIGVDGNGCANADCMKIYVIPSDELFFYNAFTPNHDGLNDVFYIGNIMKYPENRFEVYNRNGKLVYNAAPYLNDWDGKVDGNELPCATYYYVLDPGSGKEKIHGAVTIIR
ncbi:MAG: gliding motility-associated C-terminal domain-containing protein [Bacteroidetes bacterium]|nr:gliding motility-associated C-terminal domain-containing protein [Bacteroidota bacterium]